MWERSIKMANGTIFGRPWLRTPERSIPWYSLPPIWLTSPWTVDNMGVRLALGNWACTGLPFLRPANQATLQGEKSAGFTRKERRLRESHRVPTAPPTLRRTLHKAQHNHRRRSSSRHQGGCFFWGGGGWVRGSIFRRLAVQPVCCLVSYLSVTTLCQRHGREKRAHYEERVSEVKRAVITPLVFSVAGGASKLATTFIKRYASLLAKWMNGH